MFIKVPVERQAKAGVWFSELQSWNKYGIQRIIKLTKNESLDCLLATSISAEVQWVVQYRVDNA